MRKFVISILLIIGALINANAATRPSPRGGATPTTESAVTAPVTSARSAARTARSATAAPTSARSAVSARSATNPTGTKTVAARAATTTQKVINSGTKVAGAVANTAVNEQCQNKYYGCMDAFCMLDNTSGGRCVCSNRNAELDEILSQIELLDQQSYQMVTYGVEKIEMGNDANAVIAAANAAANEAMSNVTKGTQSSRRKSLDLSLWDTGISVEDDDVFDVFGETSSIDGKTGDALQRAAHELCVAQVPECASDMSMLKLLYAQKIKSDCNAYENSLKQQKNASQNKLATAERALRDAALEQLRSANKYDLGQCTIEFKKCMQTTAGCGNDFSECASVAAMDNTNTNKSTSRKAKNYSIKGSATTIEIAASSYDTLLAKKPLCETVTKQCQSVADQVWGTFLKDVAPAIKSAELIAEDNARQNCIGNISSCFQRACRDNIDPNDPDGSYDMCLTRPETMLNVCKIPLNACGIDATPSKAAQSQIWDFVVARLASMRVDSCTKEVKSCLQSEDRCGSDYTQCVGLDTDTIMRMCPYEKLVGCQQVYGDVDIRGEAVYDKIATMVQGVMLNIDNNMLKLCQKAADEAMIKVCGDTENCNGLAVDNGVGTRSFKYEVCQYKSINGNDVEWGAVCMDSIDGISDQALVMPEGQGWAGKLSGTMYWGDIAYSCKEADDGVSDCDFTNEREYVEKLKTQGYKIDAEEEKVISERVFGIEMSALINAVNSAINAIESDPTVQYCTTGRRVQGMKIGVDKDGNSYFGDRGRGKGRFPNLTTQMRQTIALSALKTARENYNKKYDTEIQRMMKDQVAMAARVDKNAAIEAATAVCSEWAEKSVLPKSEAPKVSNAGKWIAVGLIAAASIVIGIFTFGTGTAVGGVAIGTIIGASVAAVGAGASAGIAASAAEPVGQAEINQWNYKENVTTSFAPSTGICTKVRVYQNCAKIKKNYCEDWEEPKEIRDEVNLL